MEFPPVSNLISARFDASSPKQAPNAPAEPPRAPRAVANLEGMGSEPQKLGANSAATSGTNRIGTVVDARA